MKRSLKIRIGDMIRGWQGKPTEADRLRYETLERRFKKASTILSQAVYPRPGVIPSRDFLMKTIGLLHRVMEEEVKASNETQHD